MTEFLNLLTPITYWILIGLWSFILYFYVQKMWDSKTKHLFFTLILILSIDAFRTLFESIYFGIWYTSLSGLLPREIATFLMLPEMVIIPKLLNVFAALIVIILLLKKWLPAEEKEIKKVKMALLRSEATHLQAQKIAQLGHYIFDIKTGFWTNSDELDSIFGIDKDYKKDINGWLNLIHPDFKRNMENYLQNDILNKLNDFDNEYKIIDQTTLQEKWVHGLGSLKLDVNGNPVEMFGTIQNITERKLIEEVLRRNECIVSNSNDMLALLDKNYTYLAVNNKYAEAFGKQIDQIVGLTPSDIFGKDTFNNLIRPSAERCLKGEEIYLQNWIEFPAFGKRFMDVSFNPYCDDNNIIKGFVVNGRDITERELAEENLRNNEAILNEAQRLAQIGSWELDLVENKLHWSDEVYRIFNFEPQQFEASYQTFLDNIHPDDKKLVDKAYFDSVNNRTPYNIIHRILLNDGTIKTVNENCQTFYDDNGIAIRSFGTVQDITKLKQAEDKLNESEKKYHSMLQNLMEGFNSVTLDGILLDYNKECINILGLDPSKDYTGMRLPELWVNPELREEYINLLITNGYIKNYNIDIKKPNGELVTIQTNPRLIRDENGEPLRIEGSFLDITERQQAAILLEKSESKFRKITEQIYDVIVATDLEGIITYTSPSIKRLFGYTQDALIGINIAKLIPESKMVQAIETFNLCIEGNDVEGYHTEFIKRDGKYAKVEFNGVPIYEEEKIIGIQAIIRDITETNRLQELESRAGRLEMAGTIAGQVAHDFNNLLAPIMAYPEFIRDELPNDSKAKAFLDTIEDAAKKIAQINQDLLTMGRRGHYNQDIINLNEIVLKAVNEMKSQEKEIIFETDLCTNLMNIKGGVAQIHRMIINLFVNAQDAMADIGNISIKTENYYTDDTYIAFGCVPKGEYVKLTISDKGCGIPDDIVENIIDPFFSTKVANKSRGSGLGLSVVDAVVKDHGGYLDLQSSVGVGTSFFLYFPITRDENEENISENSIGGNESILIADDDEMLREVSSKLLTKLGYTVNCVESGEKAIELLKENSFDILILDMVMSPGIDGAEAYKQILEINPHQKAIIFSGYSESDRVREALKMGVGAFVRKPFTKTEIATAVRKELDREVVNV